MLDPPWLWFLPEPARSYSLDVFQLPSGDFDGDGTPDVIVSKFVHDETMIGRQPAALPLELLSGRDGRHLWSARAASARFRGLWLFKGRLVRVRVIEPKPRPTSWCCTAARS